MIAGIIFISLCLLGILIVKAWPKYKVDRRELISYNEIIVHYIPNSLGREFDKKPYSQTFTHFDYEYVLGDRGWVWHDRETGKLIGRVPELDQVLFRALANKKKT